MSVGETSQHVLPLPQLSDVSSGPQRQAKALRQPQHCSSHCGNSMLTAVPSLVLLILPTSELTRFPPCTSTYDHSSTSQPSPAPASRRLTSPPPLPAHSWVFRISLAQSLPHATSGPQHERGSGRPAAGTTYHCGVHSRPPRECRPVDHIPLRD